MSRCLLLLLFLFAFVASCGGPSVPPSDSELENKLINNIDDFEFLENFIIEHQLTRITHDSVYPERKVSDSELVLYRKLLKNLGIYTGVQYHYNDEYFEVLYWSSGILDRGESKFYIKSKKIVSNIPYLKKQIDSGELFCNHVRSVEGWYICKR